MSLHFLILFVALQLLLGACTTSSSPSPSSRFLTPASFSFSQVNPVLRKDTPDYQASGRILLQHSKTKNSGELILRFSKHSELQLQIFAPLLGTLLYEIRANSAQFLVLDYQEQKYVLTENNKESRIRWLGVDLTFEELQWMLWGAMPETRFQELNGTRPEKNKLQITLKKDVFNFQINEEGRLKSWIKTFTGKQDPETEVVIYIVETSSCQILLNYCPPKKIKIRVPSSKNRMVMAFREVYVPQTSLSELSFIVPEGMTARAIEEF